MFLDHTMMCDINPWDINKQSLRHCSQLKTLVWNHGVAPPSQHSPRKRLGVHSVYRWSTSPPRCPPAARTDQRTSLSPRASAKNKIWIVTWHVLTLGRIKRCELRQQMWQLKKLNNVTKWDVLVLCVDNVGTEQTAINYSADKTLIAHLQAILALAPDTHIS